MPWGGCEGEAGDGWDPYNFRGALAVQTAPAVHLSAGERQQRRLDLAEARIAVLEASLAAAAAEPCVTRSAPQVVSQQSDGSSSDEVVSLRCGTSAAVGVALPPMLLTAATVS